jgi:LAGLIDADG DNA endonuclease family protein
MKEELVNLYDSGMSLHDIAALSTRSYSTIHYWMSKYRLARRRREEASRTATRQYPIRCFAGSEKEKAYLFGFALGDLYVGRVHKSIEVYTSTSVPSMVDLVLDNFSRYARPKITPTTYEVDGNKIGGWRVRAFLDSSFGFLLQKYSINVPDWVMASNDIWWSFLAGLFDAEGHSGIYNSDDHRGGPTTEWTIVNTRLALIRALHSQMTSFGFHPRISTERNGASVWHQLIINRRDEIQRILRTMPFRHPKKKVVGRFLLKIPMRMNAQAGTRIILEYKSLRRMMKEDDRTQGLAAIFSSLGVANHQGGQVCSTYEGRLGAKCIMPNQPNAI